MPENAAESVVEEQRKVPEAKNCLFLPFLYFVVILGILFSQGVRVVSQNQIDDGE